MVSEATLNEITRRLVDKFHPEVVILFGSQARGMADDWSDVDVLVLKDLKALEDRHELVTAMHKAMRGIPVGLDIVLMTPSEFEYDRDIPGQLARYAAADGRVLYDAA